MSETLDQPLSVDYCEVFGPRVPLPRAAVHEPWCEEHDEGVCSTLSTPLPVEGLRAFVESDGDHRVLIVFGPSGAHGHFALDTLLF